MSAGNANPWLGLDVGGAKILGVMVDGGKVLGSRKVESHREQGPERVLERALVLCRDLEVEHGPAAGVGVGLAGLVDWKTGVVLSSVILPGWDGFPLLARLEAAMEKPTFVDNDATAAGYGEYNALGRPPGLNMVLLTVGTGIGGAILLDGNLYRGATGVSGEFGNVTLDWQGEPCWCGNRGCLNMLGSGSAIAAHAAGLADGDPRSRLHRVNRPVFVKDVAEAARAGDSASARAIDRGARALGTGIANLINIFNPDRVVLTGGVMEMGETFLSAIRAEAARRAFKESFDHAIIATSTLGQATGAFGAACLVRDQRGKEAD